MCVTKQSLRRIVGCARKEKSVLTAWLVAIDSGVEVRTDRHVWVCLR